MKKLHWPLLMCNSLDIDENGVIQAHRMRVKPSKLVTVRALQTMGYNNLVAAGDSHNDIGMIRAAQHGFLFKSTDAIKAENPDIPAFEEYDEFLAAIKAVL